MSSFPVLSPSGIPLRFNLRHISTKELRSDLEVQIEELGGLIVPDDGVASLYLVDTEIEDPKVAPTIELLSSQAVVLKWDWIIECYDSNQFLGALDNWGGFRILPSLPFSPPLTNDDSGEPAEPAASTRENYVPISPCPPHPFANEPSRSPSQQTNRAPSMSSSVISRTSAPSEPSPDSKKRGRKPEEKSFLVQKRRKLSPESRSSRVASGSSSSSTKAYSRSIPPERSTPPPSPPKTVVASEWFGNDYTDEDKQYTKDYLSWAFKYDDDPNFWEVFKQMGVSAPHHPPQGWRSFYYKHEAEFLRDVPVLHKAYHTSGSDIDDEDDRTNPPRSIKTKIPHIPKKVAKVNLVASGETPVEITDAEKRALVHFMAEAPDGVAQADLLQNFAHHYPSKSWRAWQSLIRKNKDSFDRAVVKRREALAGITS